MKSLIVKLTHAIFFHLQGFQRVFDSMPDINLDVPNASSLLEQFGDMCHRDGFMAPKSFSDLPRG